MRETKNPYYYLVRAVIDCAVKDVLDYMRERKGCAYSAYASARLMFLRKSTKELYLAMVPERTDIWEEIERVLRNQITKDNQEEQITIR